MKIPLQPKLLHSDEDTQKCLLEMNTRDSEKDTITYDNDREYVAEEIEEDTNKPSKGLSRKK